MWMNMEKSQIKMVESVFVVIIFMVILMIAIVFFTRFQTSEGQFLRTERSLKQSVQLAQTFASLAEIGCTENGVVKENCIDMNKLKEMDKLSSSQLQYYYDIFKFGSVKVEKIYPTDDIDTGEVWVIYNKTKIDPQTGSEVSYFSLAIPMMLYDAAKNPPQSSYGLMTVKY